MSHVNPSAVCGRSPAGRALLDDVIVVLGCELLLQTEPPVAQCVDAILAGLVRAGTQCRPVHRPRR